MRKSATALDAIPASLCFKMEKSRTVKRYDFTCMMQTPVFEVTLIGVVS